MVAVRSLMALSLFALLSIATLSVAGPVGPVPSSEGPAGAPWTELQWAAEPVVADCSHHGVALPLVAAPTSTAPVDPECPPAIRPGARMTSPSGCTMNFVVSDGTELYIGTAGHCVDLGQRVRLAGLGFIGTVVQDGDGGDWAFVRIDADDRHLVDPTMCRWNGPSTGPTEENVRDPMHGETVLHYGHGLVVGQTEPTRGRAGVTAHTSFLQGNRFVFVGNAAPGDSGSPVRLATGEATGILVAHLHPAGVVPALNGQAIVATKFTQAMDALERAIGAEVHLVEGTTPALPAPLTPTAQPVAGPSHQDEVPVQVPPRPPGAA